MGLVQYALKFRITIYVLAVLMMLGGAAAVVVAARRASGRSVGVV